MSHQRGFTLLELAAVVVILVVLVALIIPGVFHTRCTLSRPMENVSRLRGIHQNIVIWSQSNHLYYPGLDGRGQPNDTTVEARFQVLLEGDYFNPEYIISPGEFLTAWQPGTALTAANYSYAMLQLPPQGQRLKAWRDTSNGLSAILSDRNIHADGKPAAAQSIWTTNPGEWHGSVVWNDNHVDVRLETSVLEKTQYAKSATFTSDSLFLDGDAVDADDPTKRAAAGDDTFMIHAGK